MSVTAATEAVGEAMGSEQRRRRMELQATPLGRLTRMVEIRLLETRIQELFARGLISGTTHTSQGQEAIAVGIAATTQPGDVFCCTYRGHGIALALGMLPEAVLGEVVGRSIGCMSGLGGSMHLSDPEIGLLPTMAIVGAGVPVAAGAALSLATRRTGGVAVSVCGDGATNIGAFHEGLNLAAVWKLPVVFVVENNLYGEYSPIARTTAVTDLAARAGSYAMPSAIVDGQELDAVEAAMNEAVDRARAGDGPTLLEMKTYRYVGHSRSDQATYRPPGELEAWQRRDPIELYAAALRTRRELNVPLEELRAVQLERIDRAERAVLDSPVAPVEQLFAHVLPPTTVS